jgi:osmotically-inducible protein OsmY
MTPMLPRRLLLSSFAVASVALLAACAGSPRTESTGEYVEDSVITTRLKAAVLAEPSLRSMEINVETFKGRVQLSGFVNSQADIDRTVAMVRGMSGVSSVKNDMRLK